MEKTSDFLLQISNPPHAPVWQFDTIHQLPLRTLTSYMINPWKMLIKNKLYYILSSRDVMQIITQPILSTLLLQNLKMQQFFLNIKIILIPMRSKEINQYVLPLSIVAYSSLPFKKNCSSTKKTVFSTKCYPHKQCSPKKAL